MQTGITEPSSLLSVEKEHSSTEKEQVILVDLVSRVSESVILPTVNLNVDFNAVLKQLHPTTDAWNERTLEVTRPLHEKGLKGFECGIGINGEPKLLFYMTDVPAVVPALVQTFLPVYVGTIVDPALADLPAPLLSMDGMFEHLRLLQKSLKGLGITSGFFPCGSACGEEHVRWVVSFPKLDHILRWIWDSMGCFEEVQIRFV